MALLVCHCLPGAFGTMVRLELEMQMILVVDEVRQGNFAQNEKNEIRFDFFIQGSISPTFNERICADILAPKEIQTYNVSRKQLRTKLSYEKPRIKCW